MGYGIRSYSPTSLPTLRVAGAVTLASTLAVTGAVTLSSTVAANGSVTMGAGAVLFIDSTAAYTAPPIALSAYPTTGFYCHSANGIASVHAGVVGFSVVSGIFSMPGNATLGGLFQFSRMADPGNATDNTGWLFAKDNGGDKTVVIARAGATSANAVLEA